MKLYGKLVYLVIQLGDIFGNLEFKLKVNSSKIIYNSLQGALFVWATFIFTSFSISALGHILLTVAGAVALFHSFKERERVPRSFSSYAIIAFVFFGMLSIFSNWNTHGSPTSSLFKLKYFLLAWLGLFATSIELPLILKRRGKLLVSIFNVSTAIASFVGIIAFYVGYNYLRMKAACHPERACGMYGMYMTYAYGIALVVILQIGLFIERKRAANFVHLPILIMSVIINLVGLYLSYTRGAWIGVLVAIPFFFIQKNIKKSLYILVGLVVVSALLFMSVPKIKDTFSNKYRMRSNETRLNLYATAIYAWKKSPILGVGHRNFEMQSAKLMEELGVQNIFTGHAHNNFLETLVSTGIFGFLAMLSFHLFWFWETLKRKDLIATIAPAFIFGLFFMGQFQYTIGDGENLFLIMLFYLITQIKEGAIHE